VRWRTALPLAAVLAVAAAGDAAAQTPIPTPTPTPPPVPAPVPAQGTLKLKLERVHRDGSTAVALTGDAWRVRGELRPFVAGQTVRVRFARDGREVRTRSLRPRSAQGGRAGIIRVAFRSRSPGRMTVRAVHRATPELETVRSKLARVHVLRPAVRAGERSRIARMLQRGLGTLHYAVPSTGVYDAGTGRAVLAWRKVTGNARTTFASEAVIRAVLAGKGAFRVRHPGDGRHVEADISRQVLALIEGNRVRRIYPTSSGKASTPTVMGKFAVYRKQPGTNSHGMVHSSYFTGGYAVHGYASVPVFPASHGCLRIPIPDSRSVYDWMTMGTVVWVYP
jgi:hypothetical protein